MSTYPKLSKETALGRQNLTEQKHLDNNTDEGEIEILKYTIARSLWS